MNIKWIKIKDLTDTERKQLQSLSLRSHGKMQDTLNYYKSGTAGIIYEGDKAVAWCSVDYLPVWNTSPVIKVYEFNVYTRATHRRQGLATALFKAAKAKYRKRMSVTAHSPKSYHFYCHASKSFSHHCKNDVGMFWYETDQA